VIQFTCNRSTEEHSIISTERSSEFALKLEKWKKLRESKMKKIEHEVRLLGKFS
jgi:hypothetical protein